MRCTPNGHNLDVQHLGSCTNCGGNNIVAASRPDESSSPSVASIETLLSHLAANGGEIVSTASLDTYNINQARASNRMYVNEAGLGFVWMPKAEYPTTAEGVAEFEKWYPLDPELPESLKTLNPEKAKSSTAPSVAEAAREELRTHLERQLSYCKDEGNEDNFSWNEQIGVILSQNQAQQLLQVLAGAAYASAGVPDWVGELTSRVTELVYYSQLHTVEGVRSAGMLSHEESWRAAQQLLWKYCTAAANGVHYLPKHSAGEDKMRDILDYLRDIDLMFDQIDHYSVQAIREKVTELMLKIKPL